MGFPNLSDTGRWGLLSHAQNGLTQKSVETPRKHRFFVAAVLHAAVFCAAAFLLQLFGLSLLWKMQVLWDKPKYGGPGKKKQCSLKRCCLAMKADILSPPSPKRKKQGW